MDEDSRPIADVFWFVDEGLPAAARVKLVRDWLSAARERGWIETTEPSYPVTVASRLEDVDAWLRAHGEDYASGRLAYADVRCPEIQGSAVLRRLLEAEALHPAGREPDAKRPA